MSPEEFDELMAYYIEVGAVEVAGVLDDGEFIYKITDVAEEAAPELWAMHIEAIDDAMLELFKKGLVDVEYDEDLNPEFKISNDGKVLMKEMGFVDMEQDDN